MKLGQERTQMPSPFDELSKGRLLASVVGVMGEDSSKTTVAVGVRAHRRALCFLRLDRHATVFLRVNMSHLLEDMCNEGIPLALSQVPLRHHPLERVTASRPENQASGTPPDRQCPFAEAGSPRHSCSS